MLDEKETGIGAIAKAITSPAKLAFVGYVTLAALGRFPVTASQFFVVTAIFLFIQIGHDDYLRIKLNKWAG